MNFQDASLKGLKVGAFYTYHGSQPILDGSGGLPGAVPLLASWGTVDLMAGYSFDLDGVKTTAQLNIANLFDQTYYNGAGVTGQADVRLLDHRVSRLRRALFGARLAALRVLTNPPGCCCVPIACLRRLRSKATLGTRSTSREAAAGESAPSAPAQ